jgi:hypothetical protein
MLPMERSQYQRHGQCTVKTNSLLLLLFCESLLDIFRLCLKTAKKLGTCFSGEESPTRCYVDFFFGYVTLRTLTLENRIKPEHGWCNIPTGRLSDLDARGCFSGSTTMKCVTSL